jgi:hypothetical protein
MELLRCPEEWPFKFLLIDGYANLPKGHVTQCKSTVMFSVGSSRNDFQFHRRKRSAPSSIVNSHFSSGVCGVGPAERTGKSVVRYCPGGSFTSATVRLPKKPREMVPIRTSPMRDKPNWLKSQSLIGQNEILGFSERHISISAVSTPAATNHGHPRRSWFPDCRHLFVAASAKPGTCAKERKRNKAAHIAYKFLCSCGETRSDRFCIPSAQENAGFGEEHVIR